MPSKLSVANLSIRRNVCHNQVEYLANTAYVLQGASFAAGVLTSAFAAPEVLPVYSSLFCVHAELSRFAQKHGEAVVLGSSSLVVKQ